MTARIVRREVIVASIKRLSKSSIDVAWILGEVFEKQSYHAWGFATFRAWLMDDVCNPNDPARNILSRSHAYDLAKAGVTFRPSRARIDQLINESKLGIRRLLDLSRMIERGLSRAAALEHIETGAPLPPEFETPHTRDPETPTLVRIYIPHDDRLNFMVAATKYAAANSFRTINDAVIGAVLEHLEDDIYSAFPSLVRFQEAIETGKYICKLCNRIPQNPTWHHVLPRSEGGEDGPQVLLCWLPCHKEVVQPQWLKFMREWGYGDLIPQRLRDKESN